MELQFKEEIQRGHKQQLAVAPLRAELNKTAAEISC